MLQWVGMIIALIGLAYNGVKDYQKGEIKIPMVQQKTELTKPVYPIQYCLMAYDPNTNQVHYQHEDGKWYDYAPEQRRYASSSQHYQTQGYQAVGSAAGTQGTSRYVVR